MNYIADGKVGAGVAAGTTGSGLMTTWLSFIPDEIGKVATVTGIILSLVLIVVHLQKMRYDSRKARLEIEQMKWRMMQDRKTATESKIDPAT